MSGRTVPRFVPVGLLAVALAAPAVAQEGGFQTPLNSDPIPTLHPVAPMPRAKSSPRLRDVYGLRTGAVAKPEPWVEEIPANTPPRTKVTIHRDIHAQPNGEFQVPLNSDNMLPPPVNDTPGFYCGSEFAMGSNRATAQHAVLVIGARGLERPAPSTGVPQRAQCQHVQANADIFVIRIGEGVESRVVRHDEPPLPQCESMTWTFPLQNIVQFNHEAKQPVLIPFVDKATSPAPNALSGTWYRELPGVVISATFTNDELKVTVVQADESSTTTLMFTAQYTLTKDGLVYGAITGTDVGTKQDSKTGAAPANGGLAEMMTVLQALVDVPFSFRTKMTSAGLMISKVQCALREVSGDALSFGGMFKFAKDGRVPAPVPLNAGAGKTDVSLGGVVGTALGTALGAATGNTGAADKLIPIPQAGTNPPDCQRVGIDFNFNPPVMIPPKPIGDACTPPPARPVTPPAAVGTPLRPVCDTAVPDTMKSLVSEAFGQMLQRSSGAPGGMTLPTPRYLEHYPQYFAPDPAFPLPRELAKEEAESAVRRAAATTATPMIPIASTEPPAKRGVVGTWYRDVAGKQCVVKVSPDHLTFTVHDAIEEDGKVSTASLVITADYHMARDGVTAVGLITSVDVSFEGEFVREDLKPFFEMLGELQKVLEDKPFALTFRPYGDALVIGNVRMLTVPDRMDVQPAGYMAGRYKSAGDKLPKPKPTKVTDPALRPAPDLPGKPTLPGKPAAVPSLAIPPASAYPKPYSPQPVPTGDLLPPPYSPQPTGDLLPPQALPAPRIVPSGGSQPATPSAPQSNPPLMKQPTPPDLSFLEKKGSVATEMAMGWQNRIIELPDPVRNGRMSQGIVGQLFLYGGPKLEFAPADGTLTVDLVDETPRQPGQPAAKPERWQFSKEILRNLQTHDETFGKSYVLFLPWPSYTPDITRVRISARYDPDNGHTLFLTPNNVTFDTSNSRGTPAQTDKAKETIPAMSEPVQPEVQQAPTPEPQTTATNKAKNKNKAVIPGTLLNTYSSEPVIRMYQAPKPSESLRQIYWEWRQFWFNDQPSHLTPERVHGGIY